MHVLLLMEKINFDLQIHSTKQLSASDSLRAAALQETAVVMHMERLILEIQLMNVLKINLKDQKDQKDLKDLKNQWVLILIDLKVKLRVVLQINSNNSSNILMEMYLDKMGKMRKRKKENKWITTIKMKITMETITEILQLLLLTSSQTITTAISTITTTIATLIIQLISATITTIA